METINEETQTTESHESDETGRPLSQSDKELLIKFGATVVIVGGAAIYGVATAGYQAGRFVVRKIMKHHANKKEESTN